MVFSLLLVKIDVYFLSNEVEVALLLFYPMGLKLTSSLRLVLYEVTLSSSKLSSNSPSLFYTSLVIFVVYYCYSFTYSIVDYVATVIMYHYHER
jgi:hypothetical protein